MEAEEKNEDVLKNTDVSEESTNEKIIDDEAEKEESASEESRNDEAEETIAPVPVAPFLTSGETTGAIMKDVVVGLLPAALFGVYRYGFRAFLILLLSVTACVLTEHICKRVKKLQSGGYECSAVVTGLLFGMMLPVTVPYWVPVAGGAFAILLVKMAFGGLGRNRLNPAATAKCAFLILAGFVMPELTVSCVNLGRGGILRDVFFGFADGMIGEVSAFLLILGGMYLVCFKVTSLWFPVPYLAAFVSVLGIFGGYGFELEWLVMQVCSGSVILGAFFLGNDYTTSPMTRTGKVLYGVLVGALAGVLRVTGYTAADVVFAILIGNLFVPLLDKITLHTNYKKEKRK